MKDLSVWTRISAAVSYISWDALKGCSSILRDGKPESGEPAAAASLRRIPGAAASHTCSPIFRKCLLSLGLMLCVFPASLFARSYTPFQFSLFSPFQLFEEDTVVVGFRYNVFYGEVDSVYGLDTGFVNDVNDFSAGLALGAVNFSDTHAGLQAGLFNFSDRLVGLQIGLANGNDVQYGWQLGLFNFTDEAYLPMVGLAWNHGDRAYLGQFTLGINDLDEGPGIQLAGLGNQNRGDSWLQIAGGGNIADDALVQLGGLFSHSDSASIQLSGLANSTQSAWVQTSLGWNNGAEVPFQLPGGFNVSQKSTLQLALIGNSSGNTFVQLAGLGNQSEESMVQFAGLINFNGKGLIQLSSLSNLTDTAAIQISLLNNGDETGTQLGLMNNSNLAKYIQIGAFNRSALQTGLSIGLVNDAENLNGIQLGLFNVARNSPVPFTILFNMHTGHDGPRKTGYIDAGWTPFQFALYMPGQIFSESTAVHGLRINAFYGTSRSVNGLDLGFLNFSGAVNGLQIGAGHVVNGDFSGLQLGLTSVNTGDVHGISLNPLVAYTEGSMNGFSLSLVAWTAGPVRGMQLGFLLNRMEESSFPQIGGTNMARKAPVQIGWIGNFSEFNTPIGQIAPLANINLKDSGIQLSAAVNHARIVPSLQIAGFVNSSYYSAVQISGLYNHAATGSWLQLSLGSNRIQGRDVTRASDYDSDLALYDPSQLQYSLFTIAQISAFYNEGRKTAFQVAFVNDEKRSSLAQAGVFNWSHKSWLQAGLLNFSESPCLQLGLVNGAWKGHSAQIGMVNLNNRGNWLAIGAWNMADESEGLMLGLFNFAEDLDGLQLGLINIHKNGAVPVTFFLNL